MIDLENKALFQKFGKKTLNESEKIFFKAHRKNKLQAIKSGIDLTGDSEASTIINRVDRFIINIILNSNEITTKEEVNNFLDTLEETKKLVTKSYYKDSPEQKYLFAQIDLGLNFIKKYTKIAKVRKSLSKYSLESINKASQFTSEKVGTGLSFAVNKISNQLNDPILDFALNNFTSGISGISRTLAKSLGKIAFSRKSKKAGDGLDSDSKNILKNELFGKENEGVEASGTGVSAELISEIKIQTNILSKIAESLGVQSEKLEDANIIASEAEKRKIKDEKSRRIADIENRLEAKEPKYNIDFNGKKSSLFESIKSGSFFDNIGDKVLDFLGLKAIFSKSGGLVVTGVKGGIIGAAIYGLYKAYNIWGEDATKEWNKFSDATSKLIKYNFDEAIKEWDKFVIASKELIFGAYDEVINLTNSIKELVSGTYDYLKESITKFIDSTTKFMYDSLKLIKNKTFDFFGSKYNQITGFLGDKYNSVSTFASNQQKSLENNLEKIGEFFGYKSTKMLKEELNNNFKESEKIRKELEKQNSNKTLDKFEEEKLTKLRTKLIDLQYNNELIKNRLLKKEEIEAFPEDYKKFLESFGNDVSTKISGFVPKDIKESISTDNNFGYVARYLESKNNYGSVSKDNRGYSYGAYQLNSDAGMVQDFLEKSGYKKVFGNLIPGSAMFNTMWDKVTKSDAENFAKAQRVYAKKYIYDALVTSLKNVGLGGVVDKGEATRELLFATAIHYGKRLAAKNIVKALSGKNIVDLTDEQIIRLIENHKLDNIDRNFSRSNYNVQKSVAARTANEKSILLDIAKNEKVKGNIVSNSPNSLTNMKLDSTIKNKENIESKKANQTQKSLAKSLTANSYSNNISNNQTNVVQLTGVRNTERSLRGSMDYSMGLEHQ